MMFVPPRSPYSLIQEDLWPNEWRILVSCIMLNCTSRKQVERIWPEFIVLAPTPTTLLKTEPALVSETIASLGFKTRRTDRLFKLSEAYIASPWSHARDLPGVGEYGSRAWEIFVKGELGITPPKDGALVKYWNWRMKHVQPTE